MRRGQREGERKRERERDGGLTMTTGRRERERERENEKKAGRELKLSPTEGSQVSATFNPFFAGANDATLDI